MKVTKNGVRYTSREGDDWLATALKGPDGPLHYFIADKKPGASIDKLGPGALRTRHPFHIEAADEATALAECILEVLGATPPKRTREQASPKPTNSD